MLHPIDGIRFIHTAITAGVADLEDRAAKLTSAPDAAAFATDIRFLAHEVHMHTSGEEAAIYSRLAERAPHAGAHYLVDHDEEEALFATLLGLASQWSTSPQYAADLRRASARLRYHAVLHIKKENEIVVPLIRELFAPDEQAAMIQAAVGRYTPDQLARTFPWIVQAQTVEDRIAFIVDDLMALMPTEVFAAVKGWIAAGIGDAAWKELVTRAPELDS